MPTRSLALRIDGVAFAADGSPVETARSFVRGDRTRYYLERDVVRAHWLRTTRTACELRWPASAAASRALAVGGEEGRG